MKKGFVRICTHVASQAIVAGGVTLKPVGHQSTNWMVRFVLMVAIEALTSFGTTSPRYSIWDEVGLEFSQVNVEGTCTVAR